MNFTCSTWKKFHSSISLLTICSRVMKVEQSIQDPFQANPKQSPQQIEAGGGNPGGTSSSMQGGMLSVLHDPFLVAGTSSVSQPTRFGDSDKQKVHESWWMIGLFAAVIPFGAAFGLLLQPLGGYMKQDTQWAPALSDEDLWLIDGAVLAPCVIMPALIGMAMDAAWSINFGVLMCLIGAVVGQFCVAMGMAWHSFGMLLVGRLIWGCFIGGVLVVADTIASQFNKRRRATTFGLIAAFQAIGLNMNAFWIPKFTEDSLGADYEKANDVMLIVSLIALGVGFLWSPIVNSFELKDEPKRRYWKWHMHAGMWVLALTNTLSLMRAGGPQNTDQAFWYTLGSVVLLGPLLGYFLDRGDKSQGGSVTPTNLLVGATMLLIIGTVWERMKGSATGFASVLGAMGIGVIPMLLRSVVPQVASRDNVSTSFGVIEGSTFLGMILGSTIGMSFRTELILYVVNLILFMYVAYIVKQKWAREPETERRQGELAEPLYKRGG
jgi:MFS family permease